MPKYIYVQLSGIQTPARVKADKAEYAKIAEEDGGNPQLMLSLGDEKVGKFKNANVQGWWLQEE